MEIFTCDSEMFTLTGLCSGLYHTMQVKGCSMHISVYIHIHTNELRLLVWSWLRIMIEVLCVIVMLMSPLI